MIKNKLKQILKLMQKIYLDFNKKEDDIKKESQMIIKNALRQKNDERINTLKNKINEL
jgi:hypothetical protein